MSKSLTRVRNQAESLGLDIEIIETPNGTHTAQMAAEFCGCSTAQIAKSILFRADDTLVMFITAGDRRVDLTKAEQLVECELAKADAVAIREVTGFAIGGVSPLGSLTPVRQFFDPHLLEFALVYAAAGTPHHLFAVAPTKLRTAINAKLANFTCV